MKQSYHHRPSLSNTVFLYESRSTQHWFFMLYRIMQQSTMISPPIPTQHNICERQRWTSSNNRDATTTTTKTTQRNATPTKITPPFDPRRRYESNNQQTAGNHCFARFFASKDDDDDRQRKDTMKMGFSRRRRRTILYDTIKHADGKTIATRTTMQQTYCIKNNYQI